MHANFYNALTLLNLYAHIAAVMRLYTNIMFQCLNEHSLISQFITAGILLSIYIRLCLNMQIVWQKTISASSTKFILRIWNHSESIMRQ